MLWTGFAIIGLSTVLYSWWLVPANAVHAGFGVDVSIVVVAFSVLLVVVGAAVFLGASRVPRPARLTVAWMLVVVAGGGVAPLALNGLFTIGSDPEFLLVYAVIGMELLATDLMRAPQKGRS